jgi:orotate phosphoribosyltransferase
LGDRLDLLGATRVQLTDAAELAELCADVMRTSYIEGEFVLAPSLTRSYYFDKYLFATRPAILRRLGRFLGALVPEDTDRIAAPALGAVVIGTAVSLELGLPLVIVGPQDDSESESVKGELYPGERVTLIEDVVVTGSRALAAIQEIRRRGADVSLVVAVVDRQEGGSERFQDERIDYRYLLTPADLGVTERK